MARRWYTAGTITGMQGDVVHVSFKQMQFSPEPLTSEAFQPFGKVLEHSGAARRHMIESNFSQKKEDLRQAIWVSRLPDASQFPLVIDQLERHPHSHQAFIPLLEKPFLVVCCPDLPDGAPDLARTKAFIAEPGQGVIYRRNVWHAGLRVLSAPAEFVVVMALSDKDDDVLLDLETRLLIGGNAEGNGEEA
ncbi:ureidoglycolate lyase [Stappia stellulata]|uniref:ureidoglycolate lyase n=1 Tax=Stappia stellulata TaxID=71235 RepID=UPI000A03581F|nr:ureidoglycolate lyase [Stappia stellulata]